MSQFCILTGYASSTHGEFGWVLEDNQGKLSITKLPSAKINHRYRIYEKNLDG